MLGCPHASSHDNIVVCCLIMCYALLALVQESAFITTILPALYFIYNVARQRIQKHLAKKRRNSKTQPAPITEEAPLNANTLPSTADAGPLVLRDSLV